MKATYSVVADDHSGWTVIWFVAGKCELKIDLYATEAEAQVEADRLLALAWAPEA